MISKRFLLTILILIIIALGAGVAVFFTKGYRVSPETGMITGTGIISVTSVPDQASIFLDERLIGATNDNIKSLPPKDYLVTIKKDGYIPWQKTVAVTQGLVTDIKATLFRSIPTIYPLTYTGAENALLSPDGLKMVYVVPALEGQDAIARRKTGVWVWSMSDRPLTFNRGAEPHQIMPSIDGVDLTQAKIRWSPDSTQVLLQLPDRNLLLNEATFNEPARDITATLEPTLRQWDQLQKDKDAARLQLITDLSLQKAASEAAVLKWSPDETKVLYSQDGKTNFKVVELPKNIQAESSTGSSLGLGAVRAGMYETYEVFQNVDPKALEKSSISWLPDSEHIVLTERLSPQATAKPTTGRPTNTEDVVKDENKIEQSRIYVLTYDGSNKFEMYAGDIDPDSVIAWPDSSRLVVVSKFNTATANQPNLYGINLK
jgi:hypothetical protein